MSEHGPFASAKEEATAWLSGGLLLEDHGKESLIRRLLEEARAAEAPTPHKSEGLQSVDTMGFAMDDKAFAAIGAVATEVVQARAKFPPFNSSHEGYAVILEELDELWKEVKGNRGRRLPAEVEATQVAAMAIRYLIDISYDNPERFPPVPS